MQRLYTYKHFSAALLSRLFLQLAQLEGAGFPAADAFDLLDKNDAVLRRRVRYIQSLLRAGKPIAESAYKGGLFDENQTTLIHAAESSGKLIEVYRRLSARYDSLARRIAKVKSQLVMPIVTLIIALFVKPLPQLVKGDITLDGYFYYIFSTVLTLALSVFVLLRLPRMLAKLGWLQHYHKFLLTLPYVSDWLINRELNNFFFMLALMLDAGMPFHDALPKAVAGIGNIALRNRFNTALAYMETGASVASTLSLARDIKPKTLQIIQSGELSGKLVEQLFHFNKIDAETIALQDATLAEWLPRIVYGLIASWMGGGIVATRYTSCIEDLCK
jgi:type II secretory pathway component PulF